ncbi:MAG: hypothetical protein NTW97_04895 [Candidatus Krumholzibacteria bacterium]|nr:hypothetical protein [Candidatus Krumholzibacteria bacterium]
MLTDRRFSVSPIVFTLIALTLALIFSCSEQPTAIDQESASGLNGSGAIDPGASGNFLLGAVSDSSIAPGTLEIWAMNVAFDESTGIASFDVQILNRTRRTIAPPVHFVIANITPADIAVVDFDGVSRDGFPFYDFSAKLGNDNLFEPGERTEPVTMKFHTVTARSFAIGFRIDIGPAPGTGTIAGVVFLDSNENGERDRSCRCEPGIPGITVALEKTLESGDKVMLLVRTDSNGEYRFAGLREGVHKVFAAAPEDTWKITSPNPLLVTLIKGPDGKVQDFLEADFGLFPLNPPIPPESLFGPIIIGPFSRFGSELDSTFVNPPSPLTVVFNYYIDIDVPVMAMVMPPGVVDSAEAWINGELVFEYVRTMPPDTAYFAPQTIKIREGLVQEGENTIRLLTAGNEHAALMWRVYKKP